MGKRNRDRRAASGSAASGELFDPVLLPRSVELVKIADSDRRAADALLKAQLYPQAVFALQQAVEKTVKAIGLSTKIISTAELHGAISHRAINVYLFAMRKILAVSNAQNG
jgi:HEPN domain-containing protein